MVNPDPYRGRYGGANCRDSVVQTTRKCDCLDGQCSAGDEYFKELQETFKYSVPKNAVAGMFAESIQGVGGSIQFPKGYIKKAAELVRANGGIFISDEVNDDFYCPVGTTYTMMYEFPDRYKVDSVELANTIGVSRHTELFRTLSLWPKVNIIQI